MPRRYVDSNGGNGALTKQLALLTAITLAWYTVLVATDTFGSGIHPFYGAAVTLGGPWVTMAMGRVGQ